MADRYIAHIFAKGGRKEYTSAAHDTREAAAAELFAARPTAKQCSTCGAFEREPGQWLQTHCDIRFHDRRTFEVAA
jgi:hypothetical protein